MGKYFQGGPVFGPFCRDTRNVFTGKCSTYGCIFAEFKKEFPTNGCVLAQLCHTNGNLVINW